MKTLQAKGVTKKQTLNKKLTIVSGEQVVASIASKYIKEMRKTPSYQAWFRDFELNRDFYNGLFQGGSK